MSSLHVFHLADEEPDFVGELGSITRCDGSRFPILNNMSISRVTLAPGAFREPHWTVTANTLGYCTSGKLLVTIFAFPNKHSTFTLSPGEMFYVPAGSLHTLENIGDDEASFVVTYSESEVEAFGFSGSVGVMSRSVIGNTLGLVTDKIPKEMISEARDLVIGEVAGEAEIPKEARYPSPYKLDVEDKPAQLQAEGGSAKMARADTWPILEKLAMYSLRMSGVGMREPHWHPLTQEMGYVQNGHARMTIRNPGADSFDTYTLAPGDVYFLPKSYPHHIENLDDTETHFTIFFDQTMPLDIGFTGSFSSLPARIMAPTLGLSPDQLPEIRFVDEDLMLVDKVNPVDPVELTE